MRTLRAHENLPQGHVLTGDSADGHGGSQVWPQAYSEARVGAWAPSPLALPSPASHPLWLLENKCVPEPNLFGGSVVGLEVRG